MKRHLLYHIYASKTNDGWKRNLEQLLRPERIAQFDGRRVVAVAQDENTESFQTVTTALAPLHPHHFTALEISNDSRLREVTSFKLLLSFAAQHFSHDDVIFYAHTKGNTTVDGELGATRWRNAMYERLLDTQAWCLVSAQHPFVGCCKIEWRPEWHRVRGMITRTPYPSGLDPKHRWMLAGTFYWFSARVFANPLWRNAIVDDRYAAEAWPAQLYPSHCGLSVFQPRPAWEPWNPYDPNHYGAQYDDVQQAT